MATKRRGAAPAAEEKPTKKAAPEQAAKKPAAKKPAKAMSPAAEELAKKCKLGAPDHLERCIAYLAKNKKANQASVDKAKSDLAALREGKGNRNAGSIKMSLIVMLTAANRK